MHLLPQKGRRHQRLMLVKGLYKLDREEELEKPSSKP
ncbi:hypothetical protein Gotur_025278 [Gossypium turneri]